MPTRRRSLSRSLIAGAALATLAACGQPTPTPLDPATLPQEFSFEVTNPDTLSGAVFAPVLEAFGTVPFASVAIAPAQATAIRNATDDATLAASGRVEGTLMPAADVDRLNEAIGFMIGGTFEVFFAPEGCAVSAENAGEATFASVLDLVVWDGATLDPDGLPATTDGSLELVVVDGDVTTAYFPIASRTAWSATSNGPCELDATSSYVLDLDVSAGWQFLRITEDATIGNEVIAFETLSLEEVAAAGVIGAAEATVMMLGQQAPRFTPIYR